MQTTDERQHGQAVADRRIVAVLAARGSGGFFFDDQEAVRQGAPRDGFTYLGKPVTAGYARVREPAESVVVLVVLDDGYVAHGDCVSVQYSGVGGREPRLDAVHQAELVESRLAERLIGLPVTAFRPASELVDETVAEIDGLGAAVAYGVTQALLQSSAHTQGHHLMARVLQQEWGVHRRMEPLRVYAQTGEDRHIGVDKMILKEVDVLPHGLINTPELVGADGEKLVEYVEWIRRRVAQLRQREDYVPAIHLDVYGTLGLVADGSASRVASIMQRLEGAAGEHRLQIEHPVDAGSRDAQITRFAELRDLLRGRGSQVRIVADEWANTVADIRAFAEAGAADLIQIKTPDLGALHHVVDAMVLCGEYGVGVVLGGSCTETDRSAVATVHVGMAVGAHQILAKPGMGVDEGLAIVRNEMARIARLDAYTRTPGTGAEMPAAAGR